MRKKLDPMVDEAELLEVNPNYAHVQMQDGRETTVSIRDISRNSTRVEGPENDAINKVGDQTLPLPSNNDRGVDDYKTVKISDNDTE